VKQLLILLFLAAAAFFVWVMLQGVGATLNPLSRREFADMLRKILDGTMDGYEFDYFTCMPVRHDVLLDSIQAEFNTLLREEYLAGARTPHMFNGEGLQHVRRLLEMLERAERWQSDMRSPSRPA
jgi:hypothetical protein